MELGTIILTYRSGNRQQHKGMKGMNAKKILMLNMSYLPLGLIDWQKAVCLVWQEKAEVVEQSEETVSSPSVTMSIPSIIRLKKHVYVKRKGMRLSRKNLLYRDQFTCQYCGVQFPASKLNMDHVRPKSKGGKTVWENVVTSCIIHNSKKGDKTPEEAGLRLIKQPEVPIWNLYDEIRSSVREIPEDWKIYLPKI